MPGNDDKDMEALEGGPIASRLLVSDSDPFTAAKPLSLWRRRPIVARLGRWIRLVLGPSRPRRPPPPTSYLMCAWSLPTRSQQPVAIDPVIVKATRSLRLRHALLPFLALWATGLVLLVREQYYLPDAPTMISCDAAMWNDWPPDACGLNGTDCVAALEVASYRCPAGCQAVSLGNPRCVGDIEVYGVPLVIGGGDAAKTYRADSWVCAAAVHASLVSPTYGGCIAVSPLPYPAGSLDYASATGGGGLRSVAFAPHFPGAFTLAATASSRGCLDLHWMALAYSVACLFLFTTFLAPSPGVLFSVILVLGFLHVVLFADPPSQPPDWSYVLGALPPVLFAGYWMYRVAFVYTLEGFKNHPLETALWQGAGYWLGIESSTVFDRLPISRLGYGGMTAAGVISIVVIVIVVAFVVIIQAWTMRKYGLLQYYLVRYLPLVPILIILANLGDRLVFRLHHYLIALAGFPVLCLPNRVSLFFQAFCLGLFLDGVGRWGWDSIVESVAELVGDAATGDLIPAFQNTSFGVISWTALNETVVAAGATAFSLLVDDVQALVNTTSNIFTAQELGLDTSSSHFLRVAVSRRGPTAFVLLADVQYVVNGTTTDYSDPATWSDGAWDGV